MVQDLHLAPNVCAAVARNVGAPLRHGLHRKLLASLLIDDHRHHAKLAAAELLQHEILVLDFLCPPKYVERRVALGRCGGDAAAAAAAANVRRVAQRRAVSSSSSAAAAVATVLALFRTSCMLLAVRLELERKGPVGRHARRASGAVSRGAAAAVGRRRRGRTEASAHSGRKGRRKGRTGLQLLQLLPLPLPLLLLPLISPQLLLTLLPPSLRRPLLLALQLTQLRYLAPRCIVRARPPPCPYGNLSASSGTRVREK
mmetsp:Transcript_38118/g.112904  ORF Transcript_38118/g.112904 Transcript_38118/m.112904 type:complete len:257 (+) Transcript_38118:705-1475(+)